MKDKAMWGNTFYNTFGTFFYFFLQWVTTIVVVRLSGYEQAGVFSLIVSFTNIFGFLSKYGMRNYQVSDTEQKYTDAQYFGARLLAVMAAAVCFTVALFVCRFDGYTVLCCIAYMVFKLFESLTDFLFGIFQKLNCYKAIAVSYVLKGILPLLGFAGALYFFKNLFLAIIAMAALYFLVLILYDIFIIHKHEKIGCDFTQCRRLFFVCTPLMLSTLITPYMTFIVRYAIEKIYGQELLGYYSTISMVVVVMTTLAGSVWVVLVPAISKNYQENNYRQIKSFLIKVILGIAAVGCAAVLVGNWLGSWAFGLVFGNEILRYMYLLTPVLAASVLLTATAFFSTVLIPLRRRGAMLWCNIIGAAVCTAVVYPFTKADGMIGANNSLILGLAVQLLLLVGVAFFSLKKKEA